METPWLPEGPQKTSFLPQIEDLLKEVSEGFLGDTTRERTQRLLNEMDRLTLTRNDDDIRFIQRVRKLLAGAQQSWMRAETALTTDLKGATIYNPTAENAAIILRQLVPLLEQIARCDIAPLSTEPTDQFQEIAAQHAANRAALQTTPSPRTQLELITGGLAQPSTGRLEAALRDMPWTE